MAEREIIARLRLRGEEFAREVKSSFNAVPEEAEHAGRAAGERFSSGFGSKIGGLAVAAASGIAVAYASIEKALDFAKDLDESSRSLNVNVERLQEWRHAARDMGATAEELDSSLGALNDKIGAAHDGNREAQKSFVDLGVGFDTVKGRARETDAVFEDVIDRLSKIEDPSARAEAATKLLGDGFDRLLPMAEGGAAGLDQLEESARRLGVTLSEDEIKNLNDTNAKLEDMRDILSVKIAGVVAENAGAIVRLGEALAGVAEKAIRAADGYLTFNSAVNQRSAQYLKAQQYLKGREDLTPEEQGKAYQQAKKIIDQRLGFESAPVGPSWLGAYKTRFVGAPKPTGAPTRVDEDPEEDTAAAPFVSPKKSRQRKAGKSDAEREAEKEKREQEAEAKRREREEEAAAKRAWQQEERFRKAVEETSREQENSARIQDIRATQGEVAAAEEEARLAFEKQHPAAAARTVEEYAKLLGITKELTEEQSKLLQTDLDQAAFTKMVAVDRAGQAERDRQHEESVRVEQQAEEKFKRQREDSIRDVADLYEDLFTGGTKSVWKTFRSEGLHVISEVAAQMTLGLLSGQSVNFSQATQASLSRSPLGTLLSGTSLFGAANDNAPSKQFRDAFGGMVPTGTPGFNPHAQQPGTASRPGAASGVLGSVGSVLGPLALASAANQMIGDVLGFKGGPLGIFTSLFDGIINPNRTARANITGVDSVSLGGKDSKSYGQASDLASSVVSGLQSIADALGADLGSFNTTIGVRGGDFRVNGGGTSLKLKNGAINFGEDGEAAVAAAMQDAIQDGVIIGISNASMNLLKSGKDLQESIEKASLIESVPKLLKQRLDPLGAALDEVDAKFKDLATALREGGASADQIAQARELWQLEREDTLKQIAQASAGLKDFLTSLNAGSNSPLSLRQQEAAARSALNPYLGQINAAQSAQAEVDRLKASGASAEQISKAEDAARSSAGKIDQDAFQSAAQTLLGITRSINGSSTAFFDEFDRIKNATGVAISLIDKAAAAPTSTSDPFAQQTASATQSAANILADHSTLLVQIRDQLLALNDNTASTGASSWLAQSRRFVN